MSKLLCEKCEESFNLNEKVPYLLPCGHSMCIKCIDSIVRKYDYVRCPADYTKHLKDFSKFSPNSLLIKHLEKYSEECQKINTRISRNKLNSTTTSFSFAFHTSGRSWPRLLISSLSSWINQMIRKIFGLKNNVFLYYVILLWQFIYKPSSSQELESDGWHIRAQIKIKFVVVTFAKLMLLIAFHYLMLYYEIFTRVYLFVILSNETILILGDKTQKENTSTSTSTSAHSTSCTDLTKGKTLFKRWRCFFYLLMLNELERFYNLSSSILNFIEILWSFYITSALIE